MLWHTLVKLVVSSNFFIHKNFLSCFNLLIFYFEKHSYWFWRLPFAVRSFKNPPLSSLSIRRFSGKGERWKRKRERAEGEKRLTQTLLLEPSTPTQHDSIPSNQNHFRPLGCQLYVSKSSPTINLTLQSDRAPVLLLRFRFFLKPPMRSFRILVM